MEDRVRRAVNGEIGAVDDESVFRDDEWRGAASGIDAITRGDFIFHTLGGPAPRTHFRRRIDVEFVRSVRENDRTDVAALDHEVMVECVVAQFFDENHANLRDGADLRDAVIDAILAQVGTGIDFADENTRAIINEFAAQRSLVHQRDDTLRVVRIDAMLQHVPGHSAIHGP